MRAVIAVLLLATSIGTASASDKRWEVQEFMDGTAAFVEGAKLAGTYFLVKYADDLDCRPSARFSVVIPSDNPSQIRLKSSLELRIDTNPIRKVLTEGLRLKKHDAGAIHMHDFTIEKELLKELTYGKSLRIKYLPDVGGEKVEKFTLNRSLATIEEARKSCNARPKRREKSGHELTWY